MAAAAAAVASTVLPVKTFTYIPLEILQIWERPFGQSQAASGLLIGTMLLRLSADVMCSSAARKKSVV